jgi:hypothetical protein
MGLFRRRQETLNEQLLREAGLDPGQLLGNTAPPAPEPPSSVFTAVGLPDGSGVGPKEWDAFATVPAPGLAGSRIEFTTLPNGDLIVGEAEGDPDLSPLADAVERDVSPPYRAVASHQDGDLWAVGAKRIEVAEIPFGDGDALELSSKDSWEELRVDGEPSDASVPSALEQIGGRTGPDYYVKAERIDGDFWEVRVSPL